jgi:hypothetical protein
MAGGVVSQAEEYVAITSYAVRIVGCKETKHVTQEMARMSPGMWDWESDPEAPWWVKLRRARLHIDEVH